MVVDVIKDQNPARRQQVARDIGLLAEISGVVIAVRHREVEAAFPKSAKIGERVLAGSLGVVGFRRQQFLVNLGMSYAASIRALRSGRNWTQADLAKRVGGEGGPSARISSRLKSTRCAADCLEIVKSADRATA
jgi:hypothetical protein